MHRRIRSARRCWFSDGGIASNFPVHSTLRRPRVRPSPSTSTGSTRPPAGRRRGTQDYLPKTNAGGLLDSWHRLTRSRGLEPGGVSVSWIVRTMQNHRTRGLAQQPGYRDRIVHVHTAPDEGGLNLTMPPEVIEALTLRDRRPAARWCAGSRRRREPTTASPGTTTGGCGTAAPWRRSRSSWSCSARRGARPRRRAIAPTGARRPRRRRRPRRLPPSPPRPSGRSV